MRLCLLSYDFAPSEAAGALRWQKLSRFIGERGWRLDVVTRTPAELAKRDDGRLEELAAGTRVYGAPTPRLIREDFEQLALNLKRRASGSEKPSSSVTPAAGTAAVAPAVADSIGIREARGPLHSLRDLARGYHAHGWFARDGAWAASAAAIARGIAATTPYRALITCGPPHMVHVAGGRLAQASGIPHVADFRDPWSLVERLPEPYGSSEWWRLADRYEREALSGASLIVTNTEAHRDALGRKYPALAERMIAILNGFDEVPAVPARTGGPFTMTYAGTIYLDRDPRPLLQAAAQVVRTQALRPDQFQLVFMGDVQGYAGTSLEALAREAGIGDHVRVLGMRPRREALEELGRADMLVVLPQDSHLAIPSKLYEYLVFPVCVLALAAADSAIAQTLAGSPADVVRPDDVEGMAAAIGRRVREKASGVRPTPLAGAMPELSRAAQARKLLDRLEQMFRT